METRAGIRAVDIVTRARGDAARRTAGFALAAMALLGGGALLLASPRAAAAQTASPPAAAASAATQALSADESVRQLLNEGSYFEAETAARGALNSLNTTDAPDSLAIATALELIGESLWRLGKGAAPETRAYVQYAVGIRERVLGPDDPLVATSLVLLANLQREAGDYAAARASHERALAIREKALGPDHLDVARSLNDFGFLLTLFGDNAGAMKLYERALAIRIAKLGPEHPLVGQTLYNIGNLKSDLGDLESARDYLGRSAAIREEALGPEHPLLAWSLHDYANVLLLAGEYVEARTLYERALSIQERALGPDHADVAASLYSLGMVSGRMGDYSAARRFYDRAIKIYEATYGLDNPDVTGVLEAYAVTLTESGDAAAARPLLERVLAIRERSFGPEHQYVGLALISLGDNLGDAAEFAAAEPMFQRALAILERSVGSSHPDVGEALLGLGTVRLAQGDLGTAKGLFERSMAICEKSLGPEHPSVALRADALARAAAALGDTAAWLANALRAERVSRDHLRLVASASSEREALSYALTRPPALDLAVRLAVARPAAAEPAWDALVRSRALVLDEMARRQRLLRESSDTEVGRKIQALIASRRRLANLVVRGAGDSPHEKFQAILDAARAQKELAERDLAASAPESRFGRSDAEIGLEDVRAALPERSALVAYCRIESLGRATARGEAPARADTARYAAFVLTPGRDLSAIDLGVAERIDSLAARWITMASQQGVGPAKRRAEARVRSAGEALEHAVWEPIATMVSGADRIFVVPDGALLFVNFDALTAGDSQYMAESAPVIHYLSAERDLVSLARPGARGSGLLALGASDYDAPLDAPPSGDPAIDGLADSVSDSFVNADAGADVNAAGASLEHTRASRSARPACEGFHALRFAPIPAAAEEARRIAALWGKSDATLCLGACATETEFARAAPGRRVLHIATHGFFLGHDCAGIGKGGTPVADSRTASTRSGASIADRVPENPLLRSGLALAGANRRAEATALGADGILTAEEIAGLDLAGVEWAVLSACETARGDITTGEGVLGLRRAFQIAGVRTVVMSLWAVEDEAARDWMAALYRSRLERGLGTAEAVRAANLECLAARRKLGLSTHPYYWAGFIAAGDWR